MSDRDRKLSLLAEEPSVFSVDRSDAGRAAVAAA
jgi:hypothetical protein